MAEIKVINKAKKQMEMSESGIYWYDEGEWT